jgi:hypothetical protein
MLQIVIACTRNGQFVPTGIETDVDTFIAVPEALSLTRCPACGAIIIGPKARLGFATLNLHPGRCCLPRLSAATSRWVTGRYEVGD